eukprot:CAMPEP_0119423286 /NCGR_PEP_ID=MMETSP1335-20130426/29961_1 /TAXON_ID=259385 /ORGANISM="Chrysoculter rhomboideus, Strain RCC1486" /LENGTH=202 /DNA_ID=CAMNT_0007448771 /DNA_START=20 /DNA_END=625 /DNA_ORIENTATION=-
MSGATTHSFETVNGPVMDGASTSISLATFDGATTHSFETVNDPVMGGASTSTFSVDTRARVGVWDGEVRIVPFLGKPGFCVLRTHGEQDFPDVSTSEAIEVHLAGPATGSISNFQVQVGVRGVTTSQTVYSAPAPLQAGQTVVRVPWSAFRLTFRGQEIKGPPLVDHLDALSRIGLSTSGKAGTFVMALMSFEADEAPSGGG